MTNPVHILIATRITAEARKQAESTSPRVRLIEAEEAQRLPTQLAEIDVVYGRMQPDWWARMPKLRWVQTTWAGMEGMLTPEAKAHPAIITNARIHAEPIAEHLFGMLLMLSRNLHLACRQQTEGRWDSSAMQPGIQTLPGKTLGVLGLGVIGRRVAEIGAAFGMRVLGLRRHRRKVEHVSCVYAPEEKQAMLAECDVIMDTLPLTAETLHFLGPEEFSTMKSGALVFNIGRGKTIDTDALVHALRDGRLRGAGLDVTDPEPLPSDHPLWTMPNVIITPHYAGSHPDYQANADHLFLQNLRHYLAGEPLLNVVDKTAGY